MLPTIVLFIALSITYILLLIIFSRNEDIETLARDFKVLLVGGFIIAIYWALLFYLLH